MTPQPSGDATERGTTTERETTDKPDLRRSAVKTGRGARHIPIPVEEVEARDAPKGACGPLLKYQLKRPLGEAVEDP